WDPERPDIWVRPKHPKSVDHESRGYEWYAPGMEFEEFVVECAEWYADGELTGCFVGIRADESLNRIRTIAVFDKQMKDSKRYTTKVVDGVYNIYPIYDWRTDDIRRSHDQYPNLRH